MKDKEFWIQLLVSGILPYILGGGFITLLVQFRERLPGWFYTTFLFVIGAVLIAVLVRFAFGDWLKRFARWIREIRKQRIDLRIAISLRSKWFELLGLLSDIMDADWQSTREHEDKYLEIRRWFINNRSTFLPKWHHFNHYRTNTAHSNLYYDSTRDLGYKVLRENYQDPFSYFYEPVTVRMLCRLLKNEPNAEVQLILIKLRDLCNEFVQWETQN